MSEEWASVAKKAKVFSEGVSIYYGNSINAYSR
jgi:hypothetical protein